MYDPLQPSIPFTQEFPFHSTTYSFNITVFQTLDGNVSARIIVNDTFIDTLVDFDTSLYDGAYQPTIAIGTYKATMLHISNVIVYSLDDDAKYPILHTSSALTTVSSTFTTTATNISETITIGVTDTAHVHLSSADTSAIMTAVITVLSLIIVACGSILGYTLWFRRRSRAEEPVSLSEVHPPPNDDISDDETIDVQSRNQYVQYPNTPKLVAYSETSLYA